MVPFVPRAARAAAGLCFLLAGTAALPASAPPPGGIPTLSTEAAFRVWGRDGALFLDSRDPAAWEASHIALAVDVSDPAAALAPPLSARLRAAKRIVCYGQDARDASAARLARRLLDLGLTQVAVDPDGWALWAAAKRPCRGAAAAAPTHHRLPGAP